MSKGLIQVATAGEGLCDLEPMLRTALGGPAKQTPEQGPIYTRPLVAWFSRFNQRR